jgi:hypothetical protein
MVNKRSPNRSISLTVGLVILLASTTVSAQVLTGSCLDPTVPLVVEEARLPFTLPDNDDPAVLQSETFAQQMIEGAGFEKFGPSVVKQLCQARKLSVAKTLAMQSGKQLWRMAVDRAQQRGPVVGNLPYSDDRPLYWARLQTRAALRQWIPRFALSADERTDLITTFDKASRGMFDIDFPIDLLAGCGPQFDGSKRLIMSGFDPYTLDGGSRGTAPGAAGNNIRHGNPSGATALSLDGTQHKTKDGRTLYIEAYVLPVNFPEFEQGYLEDTVGPFMQPGPRQVNASVTVSQAGPYTFNLEQWNGRYHGTSLGNDNFRPCPSISGVPQLAINNNECDSMVVERWGGPATFDLLNPPQWTTTTLPVAEMIAANTGIDIPKPDGDGWTGDSNAFGVIWHTNLTEFPACDCVVRTSFNGVSNANATPTPLINGQLPPPGTPPDGWPQTPPDIGSCSYSGGGGNYLSNESAYRNTLLRDRMGLSIPAGHIHTPSMQHFETSYIPSDATFDTWRLAIVHQGQNLIYVVGDYAP